MPVLVRVHVDDAVGHFLPQPVDSSLPGDAHELPQNSYFGILEPLQVEVELVRYSHVDVVIVQGLFGYAYHFSGFF